jgi:hypothetical protein
MKTIKKSLAVAVLALIVSGTVDVMAQGRGNGYGKNNNSGKGHHKNKHDNTRWDDDHHKHNDRWRDDDRNHDRYRVVHYHHHRNDHRVHRPVRWVSAHHHYVRPRYVYYQDYNVYYDCHRDVYIWLSNRGWVISAELPVMMARVNFATTVAVGVDYYDDDIGYYIDRRRPSYFSIRAIW